MSKNKRGVSADEKKTRLLSLFHEKKEFFQLKDLEKIAPKEKGITVQSVKDVLQKLVDEGLVQTDKIGISTYFWAFPNDAARSKQNEIDRLEKEIEVTRKALFETKDKVILARVGRENFDKRTQALEQNKIIKAENEYLLTELKKYDTIDRENFEKLKEESQVAIEAANRWTDNIFSVKSWCKNKFFIEDDVLNKSFGIPGDLDYLE